MDHNLQKLKNEAAQVSLSREENAAIKARLVVFMHDHPITARASAARFLSFNWLLAHPTFKLAPALLIVLVFAGGGISQIAEEALPGDLLYTVKTGVNEEVKGFFSLSEEGKAEYETTLAERRLEEIEKIVPAATLTERAALPAVAPTQAYDPRIEKAEERLDEHVRKAEAHLKKIESVRSTDATRKTRQRLEKIFARQEKIKKSGSDGKPGRGESLDAQIPNGRAIPTKGKTVPAPEIDARETRELKMPPPPESGASAAPSLTMPATIPTADISILQCHDELRTDTVSYLRSRLAFLKDYLETHEDTLGAAYVRDTGALLDRIGENLSEHEEIIEDGNGKKEVSAIHVSLGNLEQHLFNTECPGP